MLNGGLDLFDLLIGFLNQPLSLLDKLTPTRDCGRGFVEFRRLCRRARFVRHA